MVSPLACTAAAAAGCTSGPACSGRLLRAAAPASARCSRPLKPDPSASLSLNLCSASLTVGVLGCAELGTLAGGRDRVLRLMSILVKQGSANRRGKNASEPLQGRQ